jgi:hypothetical protein
MFAHVQTSQFTTQRAFCGGITCSGHQRPRARQLVIPRVLCSVSQLIQASITSHTLGHCTCQAKDARNHSSTWAVSWRKSNQDLAAQPKCTLCAPQQPVKLAEAAPTAVAKSHAPMMFSNQTACWKQAVEMMQLLSLLPRAAVC